MLVDSVVVQIAGTGQGGGSGVWAFSAAGLPTAVGRVPFSISVSLGGTSYTHARGHLDLGERV